jgi:gliding motility-associated-like protein
VVGLKVYSKNGCVNEVTKNLVIDFHEIQFVTTISDDTICNKSTAVFEASKDYGQEWIWTAIDTLNGRLEQLDGRLTYFSPRYPGTYIISLKITHGDCSKSQVIDTIEVIGIRPEFELLNGSQCGSKDTVYACNLSLVHGTNNYTYLWDFGDSLSSQCTANSASNSNLDSNCNYWEGEHAKHFYHDTICTVVRLHVVDHDNGCVDSVTAPITLLLVGTDQFGYQADRKCMGSSSDNSIRFLHQECLTGIKVNYDSACGKDRFIGLIDYYNYQRTCDTTGNVTVGFAINNGTGRIYQSCDTSDYIISNSSTCIDTLWFHNWFQLQEEPDPSFYVDTNQRCVPTDITFNLYEPKQKNVAKMEWIWGDLTRESFNPKKGYDSLPSGVHFYGKEKRHEVELIMETDSGCVKKYRYYLDLGYFNDFRLPADTCINDSFQIYDTLRYWKSGTNFWRDTAYDIVGLSWDFGDGRGFATKGPLPKFMYKDAGKHTIKMASFDEFGCVDTAEHEIIITCVTAGIKSIQDKLLCGGIVRFRDSSSTKLNLGRISTHIWDFGDGTTTSNLENPFHYYKKFGSFTVMHIVRTDNDCVDTAYYQMEVEGPTANFDIVSDSIGCAPLHVEFDNKSVNASRYIWQFGDSANLKWTTFSDTNVFNTYNEAGIYYIRLIALDSVWDDNNNEFIYCEAEFPDSNIHLGVYRKVEVLPIRDADFSVPDVICRNQNFTIVDQSDSIYNQYKWSMSNGDQVSSLKDSIHYSFSDTGWYSITYTPTYQVAPPKVVCLDTAEKRVHVSGVESLFDYEQKANCPEFTFQNRSQHADSILWDFGDPDSEINSSTANSVVHDFKTNDAEFRVCLDAWNKDGCRDTFCEILASQSVFELFIPNVFTPDGDGYNNEYDIVLEGELTYELLIYNRWGDLVYESHQDSEFGEGLNWNGIDPTSGNKYPEGVYFYIFKYELDCGGESGESQGTITLLR